MPVKGEATMAQEVTVTAELEVELKPLLQSRNPD